jgi:hypothetical protein
VRLFCRASSVKGQLLGKEWLCLLRRRLRKRRMILDALRTLLRRRLYPLAAPTEKMGRMRASAQDCLLFSFPGFAVGDHISHLTAEVIIFKRIAGIRYSLRSSTYRLLGRSAAARLPNPLDSLRTAERGSSLLRRITRSAVRVSTEGAIKEWLCQPRFNALPSPGRMLGRPREIKPRNSAVMFGNKQLAS